MGYLVRSIQWFSGQKRGFRTKDLFIGSNQDFFFLHPLSESLSDISDKLMGSMKVEIFRIWY